ncbi:MAG TPA: hypothetical protein VNB23_09560 [Ramlibacter sp.]|nr:hypothetical protein [Ramlibacter sp.]
MKKSILAAAAAGALAFAGAASAQYYGGYGYPSYSAPIPAVVAGTQPYGHHGNHNNYPYTQGSYGGQAHVDPYGRQVMIDQYGRHVLVQPNTGSYAITGYDQWGRPIYGTTTYGTTTYGTTTYGYSGRSWDRDGDGVADAQDRWPNDRRYR